MASNSLLILREEADKKDEEICQLCLTQFAKYTCPRCNVQYCSLSCYKSEKHLQCSESFYEESFVAELQLRRGNSDFYFSSEEKKQMIDILMRLKDEAAASTDKDHGATEGSDSESLEKRLAGLDLNNDTEIVWSRLTKTERREFQKLLSSGKVGHLLEVYIPWWEVYSPVTETESSSESPRRRGGEMPTVPTDLPPLKTLIKSGSPSPLVRYSVINVLYAYCYIVRLFNGEHNELPLQASQGLMEISSCLSGNTAVSMVGEAIQYAMFSVHQNRDLFNSNEFSQSIMEDVSHILCHPKSCDSRVTNALSDVHSLLSKAHKLIKSASKDSQSPKVVTAKHQLWLAKKKVYFFIVWCHEHSDDLQPLAKLVMMEYEMSQKHTLMEERTKGERGRDEVKDKDIVGTHQKEKTRTLIQELN